VKRAALASKSKAGVGSSFGAFCQRFPWSTRNLAGELGTLLIADAASLPERVSQELVGCTADKKAGIGTIIHLANRVSARHGLARYLFDAIPTAQQAESE
jgi:hypothetical protein